MNYCARNLNLILRVDHLIGQMHAATMRTLRRQRHVIGFVDLVRNLTTFVLPIAIARLASRRLRIRLRRPLRERPRLPLPRPTLLLQLGLKRRDLLSLRTDHLRQLGHHLPQLPTLRTLSRLPFAIHDTAQLDQHPGNQARSTGQTPVIRYRWQSVVSELIRSPFHPEHDATQPAADAEQGDILALFQVAVFNPQSRCGREGCRAGVT